MRTENGFLLGQWQQADLTTSATPNAAIQIIPASAINTLSSVVVTGNYLVFTTAAAHGYFDGESVNILATGDATVNGYWVISYLSATTFAIRMLTIPTLTTGNLPGAATVSTFKVRKALVGSDSGNTDAVSIGPNSSANGRPIGTATSIEYQIPESIGPNGLGVIFDLALWYMKSPTASQILRVFYLPCLAFLLFFLSFNASAQYSPGGAPSIQYVIGAGGSAQTVKWGAANTAVEITETANLTIAFSGNKDSWTLTVAIIGDASHTVTWPTSGATQVHWPPTGAPVQTLSKTDVYTFVQINGKIYGSVVQGF